jgi:hypothetical protein
MSLMHLLLASPLHVLICGRQGIDYGEDEASGELKSLGYRMRAEGETAYEPDVLLRLEARRPARNKPAVPVAHVEKDRTVVLAGRTIAWPGFVNVAEPLLGLLGTTQVAPPRDDEVARQDAEALARQEVDQQEQSAALAAEYTTRFGLADDVGALERVVRELTPAVKSRLEGKDLSRLRRAYAARLGQFRAEDGATNGHAPAIVPSGGPAPA